MASTRVDAINNYIGTSTEMSGMSLTGVPQGSRFFQSNTGLWYILVATSWVKEVTPAS